MYINLTLDMPIIKYQNVAIRAMMLNLYIIINHLLDKDLTILKNKRQEYSRGLLIWLWFKRCNMVSQSNIGQYIDPVCGMKVNPEKAVAKTNYHGANIYFCAKNCKEVFDSDPKKYMPNRLKSFWNRYIDRLNKATGGKPPSCCS
jgi:Cu+-exporting ATPase